MEERFVWMARQGNKVMERAQILDLLMLLSALESWALSQNQRLPDYLHERICSQVEKLSDLILNEGDANG